MKAILRFISIPFVNEIQGKIKSIIVTNKTALDNIFHCCAHKTASQWIRRILSDYKVYKYSGLETYNPEQTAEGGVDERKLQVKTFHNPFPKKKIISPFYINFENFETIPKPEAYKAFFVVRDPRDLITSYYFSIKYSHPEMANVAEMRKSLNKLSISEGFLYVMDDLYDYGTFQAMRSWAEGAKTHQRVKVIKYEDLIGQNNLKAFQDLFNFCEIPLPDATLNALLQDHSFKKISKRKQGDEDITSHYRKGTPGDWVNYFDDFVDKKFRDLTGNLVEHLGYE